MLTYSHKEVPRLGVPTTVMTALHTVLPLRLQGSQLPSYKLLGFHFTGGARGEMAELRHIRS